MRPGNTEQRRGHMASTRGRLVRWAHRGNAGPTHKAHPPWLHLFQEAVAWPVKVDIRNPGRNPVGKNPTQNTALRSLVIILIIFINQQFRTQGAVPNTENTCSLPSKISRSLYRIKTRNQWKDTKCPSFHILTNLWKGWVQDRWWIRGSEHGLSPLWNGGMSGQGEPTRPGCSEDQAGDRGGAEWPWKAAGWGSSCCRRSELCGFSSFVPPSAPCPWISHLSLPRSVACELSPGDGFHGAWAMGSPGWKLGGLEKRAVRVFLPCFLCFGSTSLDDCWTSRDPFFGCKLPYCNDNG